MRKKLLIGGFHYFLIFGGLGKTADCKSLQGEEKNEEKRSFWFSEK